jgi:hypothetical protein
LGSTLSGRLFEAVAEEHFGFDAELAVDARDVALHVSHFDVDMRFARIRASVRNDPAGFSSGIDGRQRR